MAVEVFRIEPPVSRRPLEDSRERARIPPEKVEEAVEEVTLKVPASTPDEKVEVALLPKIVVVAVVPIEIPLKEESRVVEALLKVCNPVQVLALARFKEATTAPVVGEMVRVLSEFETEETAPPPPTQVPLIAKQPAEILNPLLAVEVALEVSCRLPPVITIPLPVESPPAIKPPVRVEVAELVWRIPPPEIVSPLVEERPPALVEAIPPAKVEVELFPKRVEVAVVPIEMPLKEESLVVEALLKVCSPVQVLAVARLSPKESAETESVESTATSTVAEAPREIAPPPVRPEPAVTVSEEFSSSALPMV